MEESENKIWLFPAAIFAIIILIAAVLLAAKFWYFDAERKAIESSASPAGIAGSELKSLENEVRQMQERMGKNSRFAGLQKIGDWPLELEKILGKKSNPFSSTLK